MKKTKKKPIRKAIKSAFRPTEKIELYNDYFGAKTRSERELNVQTGNDEAMYRYVVKNKKRLLAKAKKDHAGTVNDIVTHGKFPARVYGITARNVRKKYLRDVISNIDED